MTIGSDDPTLASKVAKAPRRFQEEADRKIVHALAQVNYDLGHPLSQILAQRLLEYGVGTLLNMARDDRLFRRCESLVRSTLPAPPPTWRAEAPTVVTMAVHAAIPRFIGRGLAIWDPDKASLLTFFVNYCLLTFKDHYLTFCRQEARQARESPVFNVAEWAEDRAAPDDVEATALARVTLGEITDHRRLQFHGICSTIDGRSYSRADCRRARHVRTHAETTGLRLAHTRRKESFRV